MSTNSLVSTESRKSSYIKEFDYRHFPWPDELPTFEEWIADVLSIEDEFERELFIRKSLRPKYMLHIFGKFLFSHIVKGTYQTPECHIDLIHELTRRETSAVLFPRGFAKSTWEKIDTIHDVVYALEPVILYVGQSLGAASHHFESMKTELESNLLLIGIYGDLVPGNDLIGRKWTNTHFETTNGVNVVARGAGKGRGVNIKNQRPTKIVCDDIEEDEQVASAVRREKLANWLYSVVFPSLDKHRGYIKMIGTTLHPECEVLKFYENYGGIKRMAIEDGESIWPEMWTVEELVRLRDGYTDEDGKRIKGIGTLRFNREYMCNPIDVESAIFKPQWINQNYYEELPDAIHAFDIVMAMDPNAGESAKADRMGLCVMARHRVTNYRYVLFAEEYKQLTINQRLSKIEVVYNTWNPVLLGIEVVMNQRADYQLALASNKYRLDELSPKGRKKEDRAKYAQPLLEQGIVKFKASHTTLHDRLVEFPHGEHDDIVDAFLYANEMLDNISPTRLDSKKNIGIAGNIRNKVY